jgi:putative photosynthetic complex assembly protein 2
VTLDYVVAILFAIFIWWFSTGGILYLLRMPQQTYAISMLSATALAGLGLFGLWITSDDTTASSAYCAFTCALAVWAWHELSFLTGFVTGTRVTSCPNSSSGAKRFISATQTVIYHELAILLTAAAIIALTWGAPNQIGTLTFVTLWLARLSAKLNVFLGVPNLTEEFLPPHLEYLKSYFRNRPMNLLFPLSITASTILTWLCVDRAATANISAFSSTGWSLLATLMFLVVIEHWFLILPLPVAALWNWKSTENSGSSAMQPDEAIINPLMAHNNRLHQLAKRA